MRWDLRQYEVLDSSQDEARRLLDAGAGTGLVVRAHHQLAGRGRAGRGWLDMPGKSLMASAVLPASVGPLAGMITALAAASAVRVGGGQGPSLKWPNDLVYGWRKVGGVLCESHRRGSEQFVISGIGLNLNYRGGELDVAGKLPPTSLFVEEGRAWDGDELLSALLEGLAERLSRPAPRLVREFDELLAYRAEAVLVEPPYTMSPTTASGDSPLEAIALGLDERARLRLLVQGRERALVAGEVTPVHLCRRGGAA
ncbi:MAG: biotin--[acetyl-CoA-carboxylase] ligase [Candidatus Geothermincolia bacterium]